MTGRELVNLIGQQGTLRSLDGLSVAVQIVDARENFGRIDVLVSPTAGEGTAWVSAGRVTVGGGTA